MPRPRKGTEQVFFDTFADWPFEDQKHALAILQELHRQTERKERKAGRGTAAKSAANGAAAEAQGTLEAGE